MPIYVQWKWVNKTETFLLLIHFDANWSAKNLRIEPKQFIKHKDFEDILYFPADSQTLEQCKKMNGIESLKVRSVVTWAPTHIENGIVAELLNYANRINGLKREQRKELRIPLQLWHKNQDFTFWIEVKNAVDSGDNKALEQLAKKYVKENDSVMKARKFEDNLKTLMHSRMLLFGANDNFSKSSDEYLLCFELCSEYIDYLKKAIEVYEYH